jgi:hypothetical protein
MKKVKVKLIKKRANEYIILIALVDVVKRYRSFLTSKRFEVEKIIDVGAASLNLYNSDSFCIFRSGEYIVDFCVYVHYSDAKKGFDKVMNIVENKLRDYIRTKDLDIEYDPTKLFESSEGLIREAEFEGIPDSVKSLTKIT